MKKFLRLKRKPTEATGKNNKIVNQKRNKKTLNNNGATVLLATTLRVAVLTQRLSMPQRKIRSDTC